MVTHIKLSLAPDDSQFLARALRRFAHVQRSNSLRSPTFKSLEEEATRLESLALMIEEASIITPSHQAEPQPQEPAHDHPRTRNPRKPQPARNAKA